MLDAAALALEDATRLLRISLLANSEELIWGAYARVRAAKARLRGAMEDYQEHVLESSYRVVPITAGHAMNAGAGSS